MSEFSNLITQAHTANQECLKLEKEFSSLTHEISENEFEFMSVTKFSFAPFSQDQDEKFYILSVNGERTSEKIESLSQSFLSSHFSWKNLLKTTIPGTRFKDLTNEIKVYELLDDVKGLEELKGLVEGLNRVEQKLRERVEMIKMRIGIGTILFQKFDFLGELGRKGTTSQGTPRENDKTSRILEPSLRRQISFSKNEREPFVKRIRFEFEVDLSHERALVDVENLMNIIEQYFEIKEVQGNEKARDPYKGLSSSQVVQNPQDQEQLIRWVEDSRGSELTKLTLLFRGSEDGFGSDKFHNKCDSQGPTITIFRTKTGRVSGGYAHVSWHSKREVSEDPEGKSFLFSLDHKSKHAYKGHTGSAIFGHPYAGPRFGGGFGDLYLSSNCNMNSDSFSSPHSYSLPNKTFLGGSELFAISDYEVWKVQ
eukprot:TRINITY_DN5100_c0_g1_i1.p1 TRINITY_DN5100_c0_g1~~TRINITY_DN5100_c0_g1_i1.p1  ORF type:complete len:440 (-),score=93.34 TRINITY_DN5100_c0_g1_i1:81-1352(-)